MKTYIRLTVAMIYLFIIGYDEQLPSNIQSIMKGNIKAEYNRDSEVVLEVISSEPKSPAVLIVGQKMNVTIFYELKSLKKAVIWTRPYTNGAIAPNYGAHGLISVSNEPNDSGFVTG